VRPLSIVRLGRIVEGGTLDELRHLTRTSIIAETAHPAQGLADLDGIHDFEIDGGRVRFEVDTDQLDPLCAGSVSSGSGAWSAIHPRSRSCSSGTTAMSWHRNPNVSPGSVNRQLCRVDDLAHGKPLR